VLLEPDLRAHAIGALGDDGSVGASDVARAISSRVPACRAHLEPCEVKERRAGSNLGGHAFRASTRS
jgi:hypothetical protein